MEIVFENPQNGDRETVSGLAWLWCVLFGFFYFAVKGIWRHAIIAFILAMITLGLSWLIYPSLANHIVRSSYLERGWRPVSNS